MNATLHDPADVAFKRPADQRAFNNAYLWGKPQQ